MPFKTIEQLVNDVIDRIINFAQNYPLIRKVGCICRIDSAGAGKAFHYLINQNALAMGLRWMNFILVETKIDLKDSVTWTLVGIRRGILRYDWDKCPWTYKQYSLMRYAEITNEKKTELELVDENDDCWDADRYALYDDMVNDLMNDPLLKNRNYTFKKAKEFVWEENTNI